MIETKIYPPTKHIDPAPFFSQPEARQEKLFSHRMLASPTRQVVIETIKDPLRQALTGARSFPRLVILFVVMLRTAWRIRKHVGKITKQNSVFKNVHVLLDCAELVRACHYDGRYEMVNSALEILAAIIEHDPYYRHIGYSIAQYLFKKMESGEWVVEPGEAPKVLQSCWNDKRFQEVLNARP